MRSKLARRTPLLITAVTAIAALALVGVGVMSAGASSSHSTHSQSAASSHSTATTVSQNTSRPGCVTITLIEKLIKFIPFSHQLMGPGTFGTYFDQLFTTTASTDVQATGIGSFDLMFAKPNGHIEEWVTEQWQFPNGTFAGQGPFDRNLMLAGHLVHTPLVGTSGAYLGMHGVISWKAINLTSPGNPPALDKIVLCKSAGH